MNSAATLMHVLDRTVTIGAPPQTVFRYFTNVDRWASWWGKGSTIDARPGGTMYIRYPDGTEVSGQVVEVAAPDRIVFTYGFNSGKPIPPGASRVTIKLAPTDEGTRLTLVHEFADIIVRDEHVQGWRYQLALFSNVVSNEICSAAGEAVDAWLDGWSDAERPRRTATLTRIAAPRVSFKDRFSNVEGLDDLSAHLDAAQRFMPGMRLRRDGDIRHCQGVVLADWIAQSADGQPRGRGTNVFVFDADGKIQAVTGLWEK